MTETNWVDQAPPRAARVETGYAQTVIFGPVTPLRGPNLAVPRGIRWWRILVTCLRRLGQRT